MRYETSQFYQDLVETSQDLIWQCDEEGRYVFLNGAWEDVLGYPIAEMLGRRFSDFQAPAAAERDRVEFDRLLEGEQVKGYETVHLGRDGREVHLVFNAKRVLSADGRPAGTRGTAYDITRRWNAEVALRDSERRFRSLFEHAYDGLVLANRDTGAFVLCNRRFCEMLGYDADEALRLTVRDIHPKQDLDAIWEDFREMAAGNRRMAPDVRVLRKDGSIFYCDISAAPLVVVGCATLMGSFRDVTERRKAKAALEASEAKFRNIVDASPMGMHLYELCADGRLVFTGANPAANRILRVEHAQFVGKAIEEAFPALVPTEVPTRYREAAQSGSVWWTEQIDYDEGSIQGAFEVVAFQTEPGKMAALFNDITHRKRVEAALAAERERLSVTLGSIGDGVISTDTKGNVVTMNAAAEELTGWTQVEAAGLPLSDIFVISAPPAGQRRANPVDQVLSTGATVDLANHTRLLSRDGTRRVIEDRGAPIRDAQGAVIGVVLVFRDVTEKLNLLHVSQRNQRLESLGVLAGGIAHDFNNLLAGMLGYIDLAREGSSEPTVREYLDAALSAMSRTRALTLQLLTFSKGGTPVLKVDSLKPFLADTVAFALSGSNVACNLDIQTDLWSCEYDRNQLAQVVDNLVINAKQAMPAGGTLRVTAVNLPVGSEEHPHLGSRPYVHVAVADTGVGIPSDILPRIFDPFFTTKQTGSGLGLATSHSIVSRHGGCIEVESEPGKGSTFHIYLPACTGAAATEERRDSRPQGHGRILVMDDDAQLRSILCKMLTLLGYAPIAVPDGPTAVDAFREARQQGRAFRAVFLDLTVPGGMGGSETAKLLREIDVATPIFVASGYAEASAVASPQQFGFADSLAKPFRLAELANLLARNLKG